MEQLIVVIIFGAIALFNFIIRQSASQQPRKPGSGASPVQPRPQIRTPQQAGSQGSDDERLRKFMEALGVPAQTPPPRKVTRPQPPYVPRAQTPVKKQPVRPVVVAKPLNIPRAPSEQSAYQTEMMSATAPAPTYYDLQGNSAPAAPAISTAPAVSAAPDLKSLLRSPSSIRTAILMKEILGAPRGLQNADVIPGLR